MNWTYKTGLIILVMIFVQSCTWDNEEDLYPQAPECDTLNVTYSATISAIMADNCNGCHGSGFPQVGVITDNYEDLKIVAENGKLWGAVNHDEGYSPMPQNLPQLNECDLSKIRVWIDDGTLDN